MLNANNDNFEQEISNVKVAVVDIWAEWCKPCRQMEPYFYEAENKLPEIKFIKLNADQNQDILQKYSIMSIPTVLIFIDGEEVDRNIGFIDTQKIVDFIKNNL